MKQNLEKIRAFLKKNYKWIIFTICIVFLLFLIEDVISNDIITFDEKGYSIVSRYLISETMNPVAKTITAFASVYGLILICVLLIVFIKDKKTCMYILINLGLSVLINLIIKQIMQRPRPIENRIIDERGYSFPSGHSMVSMAFYGFLIYLIYKNVKNNYLKYTLIILLAILIICIGVSRIYLGVHYTSDVLAGFLFALAYLIIYIHAMEKGKRSKEER